MKYNVVIQESDEGFSVSCPGLPRCWSQGENEEEAIGNVKHAISVYLATIKETFEGEKVREVEVTI